MSNVALSIGGRSYSVACADGEESRIAELGRMIDDKVRGAGTAANTNETRMLLFAALLLADDLLEANQKVAARNVSAAGSQPPSRALDPQILEALASRLENLAGRLEGDPTST